MEQNVGLFKQIAEPLVARNVPIIPLRPRTKIAFMSEWDKIATTDPVQIDRWNEEYPDANAACVAFAKPDGFWFFEIDKQGFVEQIEKQTGQKMPDTFMVRSSPGKGHFYFSQTPQSIQMGNQQGKDELGKEAWSARVDNRYVVCANSLHPTSGKRYEVIRDSPIVPAPDWLIDWCTKNSQTNKPTGNKELDDQSPIVEGSRNSALASILGKARQVLGMDKEELVSYGLLVNQKRCKPPLDESEVRTIAGSIGKYQVVPAAPVILGGVAVGVQQAPAAFVPPVSPVQQKSVAYPIFPYWVMKGTSIYDNFVQPICEKNSRCAEFMFMPAVVLMLNYLGTKVRVEYKNIIPSFYMVMIGQKGRTNKSSSFKDSVNYMRQVGIVDDSNFSIRNAEGKSLIFTVGSPEGLGMEMSRTNCKNAILFYDELSLLTSKAGIQSSSLLSNLLTIHESSKFANTIKGRKETYNIAAGSYCASLITCSTNENFSTHWSVMSGESSGMDDRFFFLLQPEILKPTVPYHMVNTEEGAKVTTERIRLAVERAVYEIEDSTLLSENMKKLGTRGENRAEKLALYFAVDMGRDTIDPGCLERAIAICKYEKAVKKYLKNFESTSREGQLQGEIIHTLQRNSGAMGKRQLEKIVHPLKHGTSLYHQAMYGLMKGGYIQQYGSGVKGDPEMVVLMRIVEDEDEELE